jgi:hypothetical protein
MRKWRREFELTATPEQKGKVVNKILHGTKGIERCHVFVIALVGCEIDDLIKGVIYVCLLRSLFGSNCVVLFSAHITHTLAS